MSSPFERSPRTPADSRQSEPAKTASSELLSEMEYLTGALSHDIRAYLMLTEHSFEELAGEIERRELRELDPLVQHVTACLGELRLFMDDLVTLSKTGKVEMEPERVDLGAIVDEVLYEQRQLLEERHIWVEVGTHFPEVYCHAKRVKQVVTNLVRNAALHGGDPKAPMLTLRAEVRQKPADAPEEPSPSEGPFGEPDPETKHCRTMVELMVHDNGPGIPREAQETIFEPGKRLADDVGGFGMGLAIARKIARFYGGEVRLQSNRETGTTFFVVLPGVGDLPGRNASSGDLPRARKLRARTDLAHRGDRSVHEGPLHVPPRAFTRSGDSDG
jgi:signal transduction histidine kinase